MDELHVETENAPSRCIICGDTNRSLLIQKNGWSVFRCDNCSLGFLDPRPKQSELNRLYRSSYFHGHYGHGLRASSPEFTRRISQEYHRIKFFKPCKKQGLVVDVGCGLGYFLYACRLRGYEVQGVDVSEDAAHYVNSELKIAVEVGPLGEISIESASVDVITMWHFLEHTVSPPDYLVKSSEWLKPDGILVIDVPNYEGIDARRAGDTWSDWDLPYHLYHFTPNTLNIMLLKHGFKVIRTKSYHSDYVKHKLRRIPGIGLFARLIAKAFSGNSYAVVAKKIDN